MHTALERSTEIEDDERHLIGTDDEDRKLLPVNIDGRSVPFPAENLSQVVNTEKWVRVIHGGAVDHPSIYVKVYWHQEGTGLVYAGDTQNDVEVAYATGASATRMAVEDLIFYEEWHVVGLSEGLCKAITSGISELFDM